jgi:PAS domain S-box-containing protein
LATSQSRATLALQPSWLAKNGPAMLEALFRTIVYHQTSPILLTDNELNSQEASVGAARLLGVKRQEIIGRNLDDFTVPESRPKVSEMRRAFLTEDEQDGVLRLAGADGTAHEVEFTAKGNILPVRHVVVLHESPVPEWARDYALFLLDAEGRVAAWYGGAERFYGYTEAEVLGLSLTALVTPDGTGVPSAGDDLGRAASAGHCGDELWHQRKDGGRFWANTITLALKDVHGELQGFARVVRDFSERHDRDEKLRRGQNRGEVAYSEVAGVVSGEFDLTPEANDRFLDMLGYSREDLAAGRLSWPDLTPPEYAPLDELAHEECLRYGGCAPFEKELIAKDGSRVPVRMAIAVLKLTPFRWVSLIRDLREAEVSEANAGKEEEPSAVFTEMVGSSPALRRVQSLIQVVAPTDATVLILGETGTGKELVARAVHRLSPRSRFPFVTLNCAAIPTGLLESELFGYERGAFTGALSQKIGRFEMAHRGTLFLDEVGDIPLDLQPKLLRALQEKAFERLGGTKTIPIDVRLVAATNRNLTQMMGDKLFRSDLYYRLKVFPINTPPLRDHSEDIPLLVRYFTKKYSEKMGRKVEKILPETMRALVNWRWPGNVRELENFIERAVILSTGTHLRAPLAEIRQDDSGAPADATLEHVEREHILHMLRETGGVVTVAATRLGLHRTTLNAMMRKMGISRRDF